MVSIQGENVYMTTMKDINGKKRLLTNGLSYIKSSAHPELDWTKPQ